MKAFLRTGLGKEIEVSNNETGKRCPNCGAEERCQSEHETAVRKYQLPGQTIVDVGWRCWNCGYEWGFEFPGDITVREAGRRGGLATSSRYRGTGFYQRIGTLGGKKTAELYHDLLAEFGRRGGRPRRPNLENSVGEESSQKKEDVVGQGDSSPT